MSGIFAYIGKENGLEALLNGLCLLETRGNDTSGIAICTEEGIQLTKIKGAPATLREKMQESETVVLQGIAECSYAGRCQAAALTAKPAANHQFVCAADGEIENFETLLRRTHAAFPIATEEDLLLAMLSEEAHMTRPETVKSLAASLEGNPSFAFMPTEEAAIYCFTGVKPLVVGIGIHGVFLASELQALQPYCKRYFRLETGESARLTAERAVVYDNKLRRIKKAPLAMPDILVPKNETLLSDELFYAPVTVRETLNAFLRHGTLLPEEAALRRLLDKTKRILLTGEGSSYHAAALAVHYLRMFCDIPAYAVPAGELRYGNELFDKNTLLLAVSYRGETDNTVACVRRAASFGAKSIAVTSAPYSLLASLTDTYVQMPAEWSGSTVSLRSFISTVLSLLFLSLFFGKRIGIVTELYLNVTLKIAEMLPGKVSYAVKSTPQAETAANALREHAHVFVTGLAADAALALEAADKLYEIAGVTAQSRPLTELSHMTQPMLSGALVVMLLTDRDLLCTALPHLRRLRAQGAEIFFFTTANIEEELTEFDRVLAFSDSVAVFNKITCIAGLYKIAATIAELPCSDTAQEAG